MAGGCQLVRAEDHQVANGSPICDDLGGHTPAFAVTVSATALALVVSVLFRARRGRGGTRPDVRTA